MKNNLVKKLPVAFKFKRRELLGFIGGTVAVSLAGCFRGQSASVESTGTSTQTFTETTTTTRGKSSEAVTSRHAKAITYTQSGLHQKNLTFYATSSSNCSLISKLKVPYLVDDKLKANLKLARPKSNEQEPDAVENCKKELPEKLLSAREEAEAQSKKFKSVRY